MAQGLYIITGLHRAVQTAARSSIVSLPNHVYYTSIEDELLASNVRKAWNCDSGFDENLMRQELQRDSTILALLRKDPTQCVVIEQWHLGNIASSWARNSNQVSTYIEELDRILNEIEGIPITEAYVSTDLDKFVSEELRAHYERYLNGLVFLRQRFPFPLKTIDSDVPSLSMIQKRVLFLLAE